MEKNDLLQDPNEKKSRLAGLFFKLAIIFGLIFILIEPPFTCPDENFHFLNVCRISRGGLFASVEDGAAGCYISKEEAEFIDGFAKYNYSDLNEEDVAEPERFSYHIMYKLSTLENSNDTVFRQTDHATKNPIAYIPAAVVVAIFRLFFSKISPYNILLIAKITNLFIYAFLGRLAIKKTGAFAQTMFLLLLLPMSIFQAASVSYDAILLPCSVLLFALATRFICTDAKIEKADIVLAGITVAGIVSVKIAYAPLLLVLFAIPFKKFETRKKYLTCLSIMAGIGVACCILPSIINSVIMRDVPETVTELQALQNEYFSSHIWKFPIIVINTLFARGGFYLKSFFGVLGWLDTAFPIPFTVLLVMVFAFSAVVDICSSKCKVSLLARLLSIGGVAVFFVGTVYAMYLTWNPVLGIIGGNIAEGIQGRYFIPVILFAFFACSNSLLNKVRIGEKLVSVREKTVELTVYAALSLTAVLLLVRYWA